jgi:hypothetical protein
MLTDREYVTPFWFSRGRAQRSHVFNRRQWLPNKGGWRLHYISLCGKTDHFTAFIHDNTRKPHCRMCEVLVLDAIAAGKPWADLPEECLDA